MRVNPCANSPTPNSQPEEKHIRKAAEHIRGICAPIRLVWYEAGSERRGDQSRRSGRTYAMDSFFERPILIPP